jgi:hypothetical protein
MKALKWIKDDKSPPIAIQLVDFLLTYIPRDAKLNLSVTGYALRVGGNRKRG